MAKKIGLTPAQQALYDQTRKLVKQANQRLVRLEQAGLSESSYAQDLLEKRLTAENVNAFTDAGRIALRKSMSIPQMRAVKKAAEKFVNSKTSTARGVRESTAAAIKGIQAVLGDFEISQETAKQYQKMLEDYSTQLITKYIPPSEYWQIVSEAKKKNATEEEFAKMILSHITDYSGLETEDDFDSAMEDFRNYTNTVIDDDFITAIRDDYRKNINKH